MENPPKENIGRMFPPRADNIKELSGGGLQARTKGNYINIGSNGSIEITDLTGKQVFFTGDTAPCDAVRNGAAGVDVLIHEAMYFPQDAGHYRSHSHPVDVGEVARQAGADRLVLTHLQPDTEKERLLNDASGQFTRRIVMATDQMRLVL